MSSKDRDWLLQSLRKHLAPAFEAKGFRAVPLTENELGSSEIRTASPLGTLKRERDGGTDLVEIQLDKRGAAAFRLNCGVAPKGDLHHQIGVIAHEDIRVHYLPRYFEAYRCPLFRMWFSVRHVFRSSNREDYEKLILDNLSLVGEVENALLSGSVGPHLREIQR